MPSKTESAAFVALISEYHKCRNARLALTQEADKLEVREKSILDELTKAKIVSGTYGPHRVMVGSKAVPRCTNWDSFHAYIKATGNFDMLHKRLTETAVMARIDNNEYVPGIVTDDKVTYKFTHA